MNSREELKDHCDITKVVWQASYGRHKAIIRGMQAVPNWIHEYGSFVRWKVLEGGEELDKLSINRKGKKEESEL